MTTVRWGHGHDLGAGFYRRSLWRRAAVAAALALTLVTATTSCQTVAITGRSQFNMFSVDQDKQLGTDAYTQELAKAKLKDRGPEFALVQRVVGRLSKVSDDPGFEWEAHLIDDPKTVNAWCMPGGKIAVYTGILPVTQDETGLAVVLAHEIGHAIARHGTERLSQQNGADLLLGVAASQWKDMARYQDLLVVGAQLFAFQPWGRKQELEADRIGLIYMARAGYDPRKAIDFWTRMSAQAGGQAPTKGSMGEYLSTHPSDERRIEQIQKYLADALAEYQRAGGQP